MFYLEGIIMPDCVDCLYMDLYDRNKYGEAYCCHYSMKKYTSLSGSCRYFDRRYYLTSVVCDLLYLSKDCIELQTISKFIDENTNNEKYKDILDEYSVIGPVIADKIRNDENNIAIAAVLREIFIIPTTSLLLIN